MCRNDSLTWLCIKHVHEWPVCWSKYCSRCLSVYFLCVDPFCWTRKTQTRRNYQYKHYIRRPLWLMQCVARCCWPKMVVYYSYNMSANCFFAAGILPVFCLYSACILPVFVLKTYIISMHMLSHSSVHTYTIEHVFCWSPGCVYALHRTMTRTFLFAFSIGKINCTWTNFFKTDDLASFKTEYFISD